VSELFIRYGLDAEQALKLSKSQQELMVEQGLLPPPVYLSPRIKGWRRTTLEKWLEAKELEQRGTAA
jgi:predicted DNA-binding transcriptional regulator AlpA